MFYTQNCQLHSKPQNKVCRIVDRCEIMCLECYQKGVEEFNYPVAICINSQSLSFFQTLTGYSYYKMFEWVDIIRKNGFFSLFQVTGSNGNFLNSQSISEQLTQICIKSLQKYQNLTKNNRQFVLDNKNTQNLYHPQFLNDIYNLITSKWQISGELILNNLHQQILNRYAKVSGEKLPTFHIKQYYLNLMECYRVELLGKMGRKIIYSIEDNKEMDKNNERQNEQSFVRVMNEQIVEYQIPYSIKQIQSFQQIGQRGHHYHNTVISISNDHEAEQKSQNTNKQLEIKQINVIRKQMQRLKLETIALQQQNKILSTRNSILQRQKQELQAKIERLLQQNKENTQRDRGRIEIKASNNPNLFARKVRIIK